MRLTVGVRIVTHFMNPKTGSYDRGQVHVGKGAYIGMGTMVVKPVTIGEGAIVGAGAIVTKDIPSTKYGQETPPALSENDKIMPNAIFFTEYRGGYTYTTFHFYLN